MKVNISKSEGMKRLLEILRVKEGKPKSYILIVFHSKGFSIFEYGRRAPSDYGKAIRAILDAQDDFLSEQPSLKEA